ncbi:hypothetical protein ACH9DO_14600 [Kocuria sp. M1N1S27]|uniref:hypothetical protein n=1 Tax=Kocuria kalidii TaxID=3376283 RepID=UPI0037B23242
MNLFLNLFQELDLGGGGLARPSVGDGYQRLPQTFVESKPRRVYTEGPPVQETGEASVLIGLNLATKLPCTDLASLGHVCQSLASFRGRSIKLRRPALRHFRNTMYYRFKIVSKPLSDFNCPWGSPVYISR